MFTREYYEAAASRLRDDGILVQWVQGYEVDGQTMRTVYATLGAVFPFVETWEAEPGDVLLVASKRALDHSAMRLRPRIAEEPFKTALAVAWRTTDLEGFLGHYVAGPAIARRVGEEEPEVNSDDLNRIEFGFARSLGSGNDGFSIFDVRAIARARNAHRPDGVGEIDWEAVDEHAMALGAADGAGVRSAASPPPARAHRMAALAAAVHGNTGGAVAEWRAQPDEPVGSIETALLGTALADLGDDAAPHYIERMRASQPVEADLALGRFLFRRGENEAAWTAFEAAYVRHRSDPWPLPLLVTDSFGVVDALIAREPRLAQRIWTTLHEPFILRLCDETRMSVAVTAANRLPAGEECASAYQAFEPNPSWTEEFLVSRARCYSAALHPWAGRAEEDVLAWRRLRPPMFSPGL